MTVNLRRLLKILIIILIIAAIAVFTVFLIDRFLPGLMPVLRQGDEEAIETYIRSFGSFRGAFFTAALQFLQVVSIIIPSTPIQIAAGILFGAFHGYLICHLAFIAANTTVFSVLRILEAKLGSEPATAKRQSKFNFLLDEEYPQFTVFFGCMLPLLPNGFVPYIAARTKISTKSFIITVTLGSFPTIFLLCAVGSKILSGQFVFAGILLGIVLLIMLIAHLLKDKLIAIAHRLHEKFER